MCLVPLTLVRQYRTIEGNLTNIVPCGKCPECLQKRSEDWAFRIKQEMKQCTSALFLTLTYERTPISKNGFPTLVKRDFQNFMKRLRKHIDSYPDKMGYSVIHPKRDIKYYACGEYGTKTLRPHYHAIMLNVPINIVNNPNLMADIWKHGHIYSVPANMATIRYVTKYICKGKSTDLTTVCKETGFILQDDRQPQFPLMSKGLGLNFLTEATKRFYKNRKLGALVLPDGKFQHMPRYYKERIFSKIERKQIAEEFEQMHKIKKTISGWDEIQRVKAKFRTAERKLILERVKI